MRKTFSTVVAGLAVLASSSHAQFVKGNEAVQMTGAGTQIQTPPVPAGVSKLCAAGAKCHAGAWRMVETAAGLLECTEPWARPGSCRKSSYGAEKLARVWVVRRGSDWLQCQYPDMGSKCTPVFGRPPANLPVDAVQ